MLPTPQNLWALSWFRCTRQAITNAIDNPSASDGLLGVCCSPRLLLSPTERLALRPSPPPRSEWASIAPSNHIRLRQPGSSHDVDDFVYQTKDLQFGFLPPRSIETPDSKRRKGLS